MKQRVRGGMKPMEVWKDMNINSYCQIVLAAMVAYLWLNDGSRMSACILVSIWYFWFYRFLASNSPERGTHDAEAALQYYDSPKETIRCTKDGKGKGGVGHVLKINLNHNGHLNVYVEERRILIPSPSSVKCRLKVGVECSLFVCVRKGLEGRYFFTRPSMVDFKYGFRDA